MFIKNTLTSPLGELTLVTTNEAVVLLEFSDSKELAKKLDFLKKIWPIREWETSLAIQTEQELNEYFQKKRQVFWVSCKILFGTDFQRKVWDALRKIPYGKTLSYSEEALYIGNPKAVRAIGGANHHNPIVIIIPCHRVIGKNKSLTGYGWGIERKKWLLEHEEGII